MILSDEIRLALCIFTVYRITELLVIDDGPLFVFQKFRRFLGRMSNKGYIYNQIALIFNCPFCLGVWISIVFAFLILFPTIPGDIVLIFGGIAGGQCLLESISERWAKD